MMKILLISSDYLPLNLVTMFKTFNSISCTVFSILVLNASLTSCSSNDEVVPIPDNKQEVAVQEPTDSINPILKEFLETLNASRADDTTTPAGDKINTPVEFYDADKNLSMQAVETTYNGLNVVVGAYYTDDIEDTRILMMAETQPNEFTLMAEDGEPLLEFTYDSSREVAYCSKIISRARLQSYFCHAGMIVLGWEVSTILAVPTGGASLGFGLLWGAVSVTVCDR